MANEPAYQTAVENVKWKNGVKNERTKYLNRVNDIRDNDTNVAQNVRKWEISFIVETAAYDQQHLDGFYYLKENITRFLPEDPSSGLLSKTSNKEVECNLTLDGAINWKNQQKFFQ